MEEALLKQGTLGLVLLASWSALLYLWKQLSAEREQRNQEHRERLEEARETTKQLLAVAERTHTALEKLSDLQEAATRRR